jgi:hypothetical protein
VKSAGRTCLAGGVASIGSAADPAGGALVSMVSSLVVNMINSGGWDLQAGHRTTLTL